MNHWMTDKWKKKTDQEPQQKLLSQDNGDFRQKYHALHKVYN